MFTENRTIGILGGGQLGKMVLDVSNRWGLKIFILDPDVDCPSSKLCSKFFRGDLMDYDTVVEFGKKVDLVTIEIENVNVDALKFLESKGKKVYPVTDQRMTRFWITLDQAVNFVSKTFDRMQGGETFVPKIPSVKILDVLKAIDSDYKFEEIGIRPGEKMHEVMCPSDESHRVIEFEDYFAISPSIQFFSDSIDYTTSKSGEVGNKVEDNFEYDSFNNSWYLSVNEIKDYIEKYL